MPGSNNKVGTRSSSRSSSPVTTSLSSEQFALYFIEALKDQTVVSGLRQAVKPNNEDLVDMVAEKVNQRISLLEERLAVKDTTIQKLEERVADLENKIDQQEQYSRRTSVRIAGIEETENEDPVQKVRDIFQSIDIDSMIQRCHRVGPASEAHSAPTNSGSPARIRCPRSIIVQFAGQRDRDTVFQRRMEIAGHCPNIFISEDLTKRRATLLFHARQLKKKKKIMAAFTRDGRVLVLDNARKIHNVSSLSDLVW